MKIIETVRRLSIEVIQFSLSFFLSFFSVLSPSAEENKVLAGDNDDSSAAAVKIQVRPIKRIQINR